MKTELHAFIYVISEVDLMDQFVGDSYCGVTITIFHFILTKKFCE